METPKDFNTKFFFFRRRRRRRRRLGGGDGLVLPPRPVEERPETTTFRMPSITPKAKNE